ncbi:MAG: polysaccharide ABC transporter ATP-binding protein [Chthoniobacteraceae bacterium]
MSDIAISARGVGKSYTIAHNVQKHTTLGEAIAYSLRHGFRRVEKETFQALDDVSFDIARGEVVGIIGRNGAGKSTLLKILSRITPLTRGEIDLHGRVGSLLEVGTGFHPELTGRENIFLNGTILGMGRKEIEEKFDEIVAFAEVEQFLDTPVKRYSSGMYVRLAFAVAAHLRSDILIVDEVLAVGDISFQKKCLGKMGDVSREKGTTVLFVSHNMAAVRTLCSRAILLREGRVQTIGEIAPVITQYLSSCSDEKSASIKLPALEGLEARAIELRLTTFDGKPQPHFLIGEPWKIHLEFELTRETPHVIAAVGLRNIEGQPLVTWWSAPADLHAGRHAVEFHCRFPFSAGKMNFVVGISSNERPVYYVEGVGAVTISEISQGEQPLRASGTGILASSERPAIFSCS